MNTLLNNTQNYLNLRAILLAIIVAGYAHCLELQSLAAGPPVLLPPVGEGVPTYPVTPEPVPTLPAPDTSTESVVESIVASEPDGESLLELEPPEPEPTWYTYPVYLIGTLPWDTGFELGLNGARGSNHSTSMRTGGYIKRESEFSKIDISAYYNKTSSSGIVSQHNAQLDVRNDWLFNSTSRWSLFGAGTMFYDELQAFDLQVNANGGVGYKFVDTGNTDLTARIGAGGSREIGGPNNQWTPEGLLGVDFDHKIANNQKLYAKWEYFPELEGFDEYRMVTDVGWEIELSRPSNMSLKISLTDRYDSTPNGVDPELLNYSVLLLWKM